MIYAAPGATFTAVLQGATTGLVGTLGVRIENGDGSNQTPRTTAGIVEVEASSGVYSKDDLVAPDAAGTYVVLWDDGTDFASEELVVTWDLPSSVGPAPGLRSPYADVSDVKRKLTFLPTLTGSTRPTPSQVVEALSAASDELDAALALVDYTVPVPPTATIALGALREWAAIGAAGEVAYSLPQGSDSKHLGYRERFSVILDEIRDRSRDLPDAPRDARARMRVPARPRSGPGASPMFSRDSLDDR